MDFSLSSSLVGSAVSNQDKLALDLQFATDKTLTARKGPTPVFVRGSGATFVDSDKLVKYGPENLLLQSEAFATSWSNTDALVSSDVTTAPNGLATADKLVVNSGVSNGRVTQTFTLSGVHTMSVYAKAAEWSWIAVLPLGAGNGVWFNLANGTVGTQTSGYVGSISSVGNGWYRCSVVFTGSSITTTARIVSTNMNGFTFSTGDGTSGIFIWGAQLERSSTARTYNPTTTAAFYGPRFEHDPITGVCKGLLMEEARTNAAWYSGALVVGTGWSANATPSVTSVVNGLGPDGNNAYEITEIANTGSHTLFNTGGTGTTGATSVVNGTAYTGSIFVKKVAGSVDWIQLSFSTIGFGSVQYANFNISNGTIGNFSSSSPKIQDAGNGWYRCSVSAAATTTTTTTSNLFIGFTNNTDTTTRMPSYAGNTANKILAAMVQFEAGSFPTSYIPTVAASVIRSADVCSITGTAFSGFYNNTQGTLVTNAAALGFGVAQNPVVSIENGTTQVMRLRYVSVTNRLSAIVSAVGLTPASNYDVANTFYKAALSAGATGADFVINGAQIPDTYTGSVLTADNMKISQSTAGVTNTCVASIRYYRKQLPVSKLQAITV